MNTLKDGLEVERLVEGRETQVGDKVGKHICLKTCEIYDEYLIFL